MYFAQNRDTAYTTLVWNVRYAMKGAYDSLMNDRNSVGAMFANGAPHNWASDISWRAEMWMMKSHTLNFLHHFAAILADKTQEACEQAVIAGIGEEEFDAVLDGIASDLKKWAAEDALGLIYRGVESSSNSMTILCDKAKVDAAKHVLEVFGLSQHRLISTDAIADVFSGMDRRKKEAEELRSRQAAITPAKVMLVKVGSTYSLDAYNSIGNFMERKTLSASRKPDALAVAKEWAEDLRTEALKKAEAAGFKMEGYDRFNPSTPTVEA